MHLFYSLQMDFYSHRLQFNENAYIRISDYNKIDNTINNSIQIK